ncbi:class I SAM-dependent methyltransferase [Jonesia quinghaiensis]|uniref:class I SAM-dependent methyltransferase n=1 Tax=Jonesia quinghaiensis TaxID=262806 RepID=UPI00316ADAFC
MSEDMAQPKTGQYFDAAPESEDKRRTISVTLAGRHVDVVTSSGVFSPGHVDTGTAVLLRKMVAPPEGDVVDVGCGWGPIALTMAMMNPEARVWAVDVNPRSVELTAHNAKTLGLSNVNAVLASDIPSEQRFKQIWSNPPIRIGKPALHDLLTLWLGRLEVDGDAFMVVQKNLGADSLVAWLNSDQGPSQGNSGLLHTSKVGSAKGFRVLRTVRSSGS